MSQGLSHANIKEEGINVFAVALHAHSAGNCITQDDEKMA